jgi:hypothetical protein
MAPPSNGLVLDKATGDAVLQASSRRQRIVNCDPAAQLRAANSRKTIMPIRFSTEAANADVLGDDADTSAPERSPKAAGADGSLPQRFSRPQYGDRRSGEPQAGQAKPGKDINAAGFIKDKDSSKP